MTFFANTRVRLGPGAGTEDEYGDPTAGTVDSDGLDFEAGLTEKTRLVFDDSTQSARTIRYAILRLSPTAPPVSLNDLVLDIVTGKTWIVEEKVGPARSIFGSREVTFNLKVTDSPE